jgi:hypothetical protein
MHRLSKKLSILLAGLLTLSILAVIPVAGSTGNIHIDSLTAPSPTIEIEVGVETLPLYFGDVTWSGGQVDLYLSKDGYASLTIPGDTRYGPVFSVSNISDTGYVSTYDWGDISYTVGSNWINGTIPEDLDIPGGAYYVKAFDGATAAVAVTDNYFTIAPTFKVVPTWGPGGRSIDLEGYALPPNDYANLSWDSVYSSWADIQDLVPADDLGRFTYNMPAPDLTWSNGTNPGLMANTSDTITFRCIVNSTGETLTATYDEYRRGIHQVIGVDRAITQTSTDYASNTLFGNGTNFYSGTYQVDVTVLGELVIVGWWFNPGEVSILWDGDTLIGTTVANSTHGWFNTTVTSPISSLGRHNVTLDDGMCIFWFDVNIVPTLILEPDEGPVGTSVIAKGYGFPESNGDLINVSIWWDYVDACDVAGSALNLTFVVTDTNGFFTTSFDVPSTVGGDHTVTAVTNDTSPSPGEFDGTSAYDTFTVTPTLAIVPSEITNDGTVVTVVGTGLDYGSWYDLCLDNKKNFYSANVMIDFGMWVWDEYWGEASIDDLYQYESAVTSYFLPNCTGYVDFEFIAAGFQPGTHVVTLYKLEESHQLPVIEDFALFTVTAEDPVLIKLDEIEMKLDEIHDAVMDIDFSGLEDDLEDVIAELATLEDIGTDVSSVLTQLSDIKALSQTAATSATEASTKAGTAASSAEAAETAAEAANATVSGISMAVYGAIVLSLIAALASIVAVITLQRKVA